MQTKFLDANGGKIAYDEIGGGPLVLLVPSMGDVRAEFRFLAPKLAEAGYRAVSLDVRGHGESSTHWSDYSVAGVGADLLALIRAENRGKATIIGDSMAGGAAVWAAAEAPESVDGLVLIDPFVRGEGNLPLQLLFRAMFARPWGPTLWVRYYQSLYPTRKPTDFSQYLAALRANLSEPGRLEALQHMLGASKRSSAERVARVTAPTLVLMGSKDPDFKNPESEAQWVAENVHGTYILIPDAGHYPHAEMPEVTTPLILDFLKTLDGKKERAYAA